MSRDVFLRYFDGFWRTIFGQLIKNTDKMGQNTRKYCHVTSNVGHVMIISDPSNSPGVRRSSGLTPYPGDFSLSLPKLLRAPPHFLSEQRSSSARSWQTTWVNFAAPYPTPSGANFGLRGNSGDPAPHGTPGASLCGKVSMTSTIAVGAFSRTSLRSTHIALGEF